MSIMFMQECMNINININKLIDILQLYKNDADFSINFIDRNNKNMTPILYLCSNPNITIEIAQLLIYNGANIYAYDNEYKNVLMYICDNKNLNYNIFKFFYEKFENNVEYLNSKNIYNINILYYLAKNENLTIDMLILLENKIKFNIISKNNYCTPLIILTCNPNLNYDLLKHFIDKMHESFIVLKNTFNQDILSILCFSDKINVNILNLLLEYFKNKINHKYLSCGRKTLLAMLCDGKSINLLIFEIMIKYGAVHMMWIYMVKHLC